MFDGTSVVAHAVAGHRGVGLRMVRGLWRGDVDSLRDKRFRWWVPIVGFSLGMALVTGAVVAWSERGVAASYAAVLEGLTTNQRRQIAQVWRPGAVPSDPAVLTAALRLHDLAERYRLGKRRRRTVGAVLVCIATVMLVATVVSARHTFSASTLMFLLVGACSSLGPRWRHCGPPVCPWP